MSAFIVSDNHINTLATLAGLYVTGTDPKAAAQLLYKANVDSVNHRYDDNEPTEYNRYKPANVDLSPAQIIKACNCFDYQACELDDYESGAAAKLVDKVRAHAIRNVPGYEEASWEL